MYITFDTYNKMKNGRNTNASEQFQNSNRKIVERGEIDTLNSQIHDLSLYWLGTDIAYTIRVLDFGIVPSVWYYLILILSINEYLQHRFPVSSEHLWNLLGQLEQGWSTMKGLSPVITLEGIYYKFQEEFEDTKWVIRIRISMKTDKTMVKRYQRGNQNPYIDEEQTKQWSKDTKWVIRIRISMKNRQNNGQKIPKG